MKRTKETSRSSFPILFLAPLLALFLVENNAESQDSAHHGVVPLHKIPPGQWVEKVWGDPDRPDAPFVIRIHNDAGYVVLPHTHPIDENIVVVQGSISLGMGRRFDRSALEPMELGAFSSVPRTIAHFAWSKAEYNRLIKQVEFFRPLTERMLRAAGIVPGMHVLDIGCGAGDVSFLDTGKILRFHQRFNFGTPNDSGVSAFTHNTESKSCALEALAVAKVAKLGHITGTQQKSHQRSD